MQWRSAIPAPPWKNSRFILLQEAVQLVLLDDGFSLPSESCKKARIAADLTDNHGYACCKVCMHLGKHEYSTEVYKYNNCK